MNFATIFEASVPVREITLTLVLIAVLIYTTPHFYTNILESTSNWYKDSDSDFDCYDVYNAAIDEKGEHYRLPLVGAAIHVTFTMLAYAFTICDGLKFLAIVSTDVVTSFQDGILELLNFFGVFLTALIIATFSSWVFYSLCKSYVNFNKVI